MAITSTACSHTTCVCNREQVSPPAFAVAREPMILPVNVLAGESGTRAPVRWLVWRCRRGVTLPDITLRYRLTDTATTGWHWLPAPTHDSAITSTG